MNLPKSDGRDCKVALDSEIESAGLLPASEQPGHVAPVKLNAEGCATPAADPMRGMTR
jgi:hypothetical protein